MTIRELIKNKDYDRIEIRHTFQQVFEKDIKSLFAGVARSEGGELITMDGDSYNVDETVISYSEFENPDMGVTNGLTVILQGRYKD